MDKVVSKLELREKRVSIPSKEMNKTLIDLFKGVGCSEGVSSEVAAHLVDASLCGVESHGVMRAIQYIEQFKSGYIVCSSKPKLKEISGSIVEIDGDGGIGIPAMRLAFERAINLAEDNGISATAIKNVGHTGRHGAYAEIAANKGFLTILMGGGNREEWRQVAPHGGTEAKLPTNPWCIGIPGGFRGPVVLDFATSKIAGGWIYAAKSAGALLPIGCIIDKNGKPTRDPEDYFKGGAILPFGEHKGFGLALIGELIGSAMLGPVKAEANWFLICCKVSKYNGLGNINLISEQILSELRNCPTTREVEKIEIPGERERQHRKQSNGMIFLPKRTWEQIRTLKKNLSRVV